MPELPEVEIVRQSLNKKIKGKIIKKVIVKNRNLRLKVPINFARLLKNKKVLKVDRFSKYLILFLQNDNFCLIHLGMSGTIHLVNYKKKDPITNMSFYNSPILPKKHNHIEFYFKDFKIIYNDPRRFGFFEIFTNSDLLKKRLNIYGPEPFNSQFNLKYIISYFKNKEQDMFAVTHTIVNPLVEVVRVSLTVHVLSKLKTGKRSSRQVPEELTFLIYVGNESGEIDFDNPPLYEVSEPVPRDDGYRKGELVFADYSKVGSKIARSSKEKEEDEGESEVDFQRRRQEAAERAMKA